MFWIVAAAVVVVLLAAAWWFGRHQVTTADQLERQRRQRGMHNGNGSSFGDR